MSDAQHYKDLEAKYYMQVVNRMPPVLVRGEGSRVFDTEGKSYLDFTAGWAVLNMGHSHPKVTKAIADQAAAIMQMSNLFYTTPQLPLAQFIVENSHVDRVFSQNLVGDFLFVGREVANSKLVVRGLQVQPRLTSLQQFLCKRGLCRSLRNAFRCPGRRLQRCQFP